MADKEDKDNKIEKLKKDYEVLRKKHSLPTFEELNEDFQIEKMDPDSDFLIREVRRWVSEKSVNYLKLVETLMNPSNVPFFVYSIVKVLGKEEKDKLNEFYNKLSKRQVEIIKLDLVYNEKNEVKFIKDVFNEWKIMKVELFDIIDFVEKNVDKKSEVNNPAYFG